MTFVEPPEHRERMGNPEVVVISYETNDCYQVVYHTDIGQYFVWKYQRVAPFRKWVCLFQFEEEKNAM